MGWEDPLEKEMAIHSSILAWRIPMGRGAWVRYSSQGLKESGTTERLDFFFSPSFPLILLILLLYLNYTFYVNVHIILNGNCVDPEG